MKPDFITHGSKRFLDIFVGTFGCMTFLAVWPLLALLIRRESKGDSLYSQIRVGKNRRSNEVSVSHDRRSQNVGGIPFRIYKFRSMRSDAEIAGPQKWQKGGDTRVTRVGAFLRKFHLDELPQFWNVLKGEMSFIGPRPERPNFTLEYAQTIPSYTERTLHTRPGLTGLAQIVLGYDDDFDSVRRKTQCDLSYRVSLLTFGSFIRMEAWVLWNTLIYLAKGRALDEKASSFLPPAGYQDGWTSAIIRHRGVVKPLWVRTSAPFTLPIAASVQEDVKATVLEKNEVQEKHVAEKRKARHGLAPRPHAHEIMRIYDRDSTRKSSASSIEETRIPKTPATQDRVAHHLTFDVECWFHAHNLGIAEDRWDKLDPRLEPVMHRLLDLLRDHQAKATFFVLGWVADRFPDLVRRISAEGHEVGTHGDSHRLITAMGPDEFERDLCRSLESLARCVPQPIRGHRASNFSVVQESLWALDILAKHGIEYDSSIFPVRRKRYGIPDWPVGTPHRVALPSDRYIHEFPMSALRGWGGTLPMAGGGYFRLYPIEITERFLTSRAAKGEPAMVYLHPWEFDAAQPHIARGGVGELLHYIGLEKTEAKLERLLAKHAFESIAGNMESAEIQKGLRAAPVDLRPKDKRRESFGNGTWLPGLLPSPL
jgi:polysaccharide deacetylase family protein (PEP-CTERM system associated)